MDQSPSRLTRADIHQWFKLWDAVHQVGYDLYGFSQESIWKRVELGMQPDEQTETACADSDEHLSPERQQLRTMAREQLHFSAQHLAFLLDTLFFKLWYRLEPNDTASKLNLLTERKISIRVTEIGERVGTKERLPQFALRRTVNQFADDALLLHRIWDQYGDDQPEVIKRSLDSGNKWAAQVWQTLSRYVTCTAVPLTYIHTMAGIRLIPYNSVPLIGFPSSALAAGLNREYLAIPHELGHYLFWQGRNAEGKFFFKQIADLPEWKSASGQIRGWTEEIFADIVGTLVGGPATVLTLQDMMLEKIGNLFLQDDNHYPPPVVRPYVGLKVCEMMGWNVSATGLADRWEGFLVERLGCDWADEGVAVRSGCKADEAKSLDCIRNDLVKLTSAILSLFHLDDFKQPQSMWTSDTDYNADDVEFYKKIDAKSPKVAAVCRSIPEPRSWLEIVAEVLYQQDPDSADKFIRAAKGQAANEKEWWNQVLDLASSNAEINTTTQPLSISLIEWFGVLYLGGWGDAGPTGGSPHEFG